MYLPEDVFQKEVSHRLNRPARLSNEKVNNNQFLYTNSVLKTTTRRDKQLNAKVMENLWHELHHFFTPAYNRGDLIDNKIQSRLQNNKTN